MFKLKDNNTLSVETMETENGPAFIIRNPEVSNEYTVIAELSAAGLVQYPVKEVLSDWDLNPEIFNSIPFDEEGYIALVRKGEEENEEEDEEESEEEE